MERQRKTLETREYTVAWVSAISREYLAACKALDEEHDEPSDLENDSSCYSFGRIHGHNVVVACLARMGVPSASILAESLQRSFANLQFALLVGIAGGAPTKDKDIRLGDVVVGEPSNSHGHVGVIYYGNGATLQGKGFQKRTGSNLTGPSTKLLSAVNKLKNKHSCHGYRLNKLVQDLVDASKPVLDEYQKPHDSTDVLYVPSYTHPEGSPQCDGVCETIETTIVKRPPRLTHKRHAIHYGAIGSADNIMRDATVRDMMAEEDHVLCFEMEAAGMLHSDLRCMVIRGICDYSDSHKNDAWQNYAAAAATVYAKDLLQVVKPHKLSEVSKVSMDGIVPRRRDLFDILKFENMHDKRISSKPQKYCEHDWVWKTTFPNWLSSEEQFYWISGKPGSGKSTLVAYLIHNDRTLRQLKEQDKSFSLLHFYFDYRAGKGLANNTLGMFRMFLFQLAEQNDKAKTKLEDLWRTGGLKIDSQDYLFDATCKVIKECDQKFCIFIDGIDEFDGEILELIYLGQQLMERTSVKLCLASRPDDSIGDRLKTESHLVMQNQNEDSMRSYVDQKIKSGSSIDLTVGKRFTSQLVNRLISKAQGVLLWFKLAVDEVMEQLSQGKTEKELEEFIEKLPLTLDDVYTRILERIPPAQCKEAALILYLTDKLRTLSSWTEEGVEPNMEFTTTNLDHLWGAYDFIVDQFGDEMGITRLTDHNELKTRIRQLLKGLVEFASATKREAQLEDFCGVTKLDVRYVHETFSAYLSETDWVELHLPEAMTRIFPKPFWLNLSARVVLQAAKDQIIRPQLMEDGLKELNSYLKTAMFLSKGDHSYAIGRALLHVLRGVAGRRSVVLALHSEFCPAPLNDRPDDNYGKRLYKYVTANVADAKLPPVWKSRHVILRTSAFLLSHLAYQHELEGNSSYPIISKAMQSYLSPVLGYCWIQSGKAVDFGLLRTLHKSTHLREIYDLFLAISGDLTLYVKDRLAVSSLSGAQQDFLFQTVLSHPCACCDPSWKALDNILSTLTTHCRPLKALDICSYFRDMKCWDTASQFATILAKYAPKNLNTAQDRHECCQKQDKKSGLLYHWAGATCAAKCSCGGIFVQTPKRFGTVLELLIEKGQDINKPCYSGGTVLQALLDISVQPPDGRGALNRYAKFRALTEHGLNPDASGKTGKGLQMVSAFKDKIKSRRKLHRYPGGYYWSPNAQRDEKDANLIMEDLKFYGQYQKWPERDVPKETDETAGKKEEPVAADKEAGASSDDSGNGGDSAYNSESEDSSTRVDSLEGPEEQKKITDGTDTTADLELEFSRLATVEQKLTESTS